MSLGGLDCVLMHPEFLRDQSPNSLLARLRAANQRVAVFGWSPSGKFFTVRCTLPSACNKSQCD